jgi:hypothetical protein
MANKNQQLISLLTGAASALNYGMKGAAEKQIREAYRAICTPATEAEIQAARLLYETDEVEVDMDALASHADDEKDVMGVWVQAWVWVGKPAAVCRFPGCETVEQGHEVDLREHAATHEAGASEQLLERLRADPLSFFNRV